MYCTFKNETLSDKSRNVEIFKITVVLLQSSFISLYKTLATEKHHQHKHLDKYQFRQTLNIIYTNYSQNVSHKFTLFDIFTTFIFRRDTAFSDIDSSTLFFFYQNIECSNALVVVTFTYVHEKYLNL